MKSASFNGEREIGEKFIPPFHIPELIQGLNKEPNTQNWETERQQPPSEGDKAGDPNIEQPAPYLSTIQRQFQGLSTSNVTYKEDHLAIVLAILRVRAQ